MALINFETRELLLVQTIAASGSLSRAAEKLNITQSALSKQLLALEERIGASLFSRQPRGMRLTDIGCEVLNVAEDILARLNQAEHEISRLARGEGGELKLGVHCISCYSWLPDVLARFQREYPEAKLSVVSCDDYVKDFDLDRIEIAITHLHADELRRGVAYEDLFTASIVAIMARSHPLAAKAELDLADFAPYDYYSLLDKTETPFYNYFLKPAGIEPRNFVVLSQAQAMMAMIASTEALGLLPGFLVRGMVAEGKLVQAGVAGVPLAARLQVASKAGRPLSQYARAFIAMAREAVVAE